MSPFPFFYKQPNYWTCGPAVARLILHSFGQKKPLHEIIKITRTTKSGTSNRGLKRVLKKNGIKFQEKQQATLAEIKRKIKTHWLLVAYWIPTHKEAHYSLVKKIDSKRIYFHDTWFGANHSYTHRHFLNNWWDGEAKQWLLSIKKPRTNRRGSGERVFAFASSQKLFPSAPSTHRATRRVSRLLSR